MRASLTAMVWIASLLAAFTGGCTRAIGECDYDTDCRRLCEICDQQAHVCVEDPDCLIIVNQQCRADTDCDPLSEFCYKEGAEELGQCRLRQGGDPGPGGDRPADGDSAADDTPQVCLNPALDCSVPQSETPVSQGTDRDGDDWGECCDCDDQAAGVNPSRSEIIYNCTDDDCNPATPDDDLDFDGYGNVYRVCGQGTDCDDLRKNVHPTATEICDGADNDCNGQIDQENGESVCVEVRCSNVAGTYHAVSACPPLASQDVDITQDVCTLSFSAGASSCSGSIDASMRVNFQCSGIAGDCTGFLSTTNPWTLDCSPACSFELTPSLAYTDCSSLSDPRCVAPMACGAVCDGNAPRTVCVGTVPAGRPIGFHCDAALDIGCLNEFCFQNACAAACTGPADCVPFPGTTCQNLSHTACGSSTSILLCAPENPGETRCDRNLDCAAGRVCSYRQKPLAVIPGCIVENAGGASPGEACTTFSDCRSNLCVCGFGLCLGQQGRCSNVCTGAADCPPGSQCGTVVISDLGGSDHLVPACVWPDDSCGRNEDCPPLLPACRIEQSPDGYMLTQCGEHAGPDAPNTGMPCTYDGECFAALCHDQIAYCAGVCTSDADCPVFEGSPTCTGDDDCGPGYLCENDACERRFVCKSNMFLIDYDEYGTPILDAVPICNPVRRPCQIDTDCPAGQVCKLYFNAEATAPEFVCDPPLGFADVLGDLCWYPDGTDCDHHMCIYDGWDEYCSRPCRTDADCFDPDWDYRCTTVVMHHLEGASYLNACVEVW